MNVKRLQIDAAIFSCSICLDLLKDPVTIQCGHSYCMSCVDTHWDGEEEKQSYSCPQCRYIFPQRPVLVKNTLLAILMDGLKKSGPLPSAAMCPPPVVCSSVSPGDVLCDLCCGKKVRAVKSCLQCLVSYCKEHLQPHYNVTALKKHKLVVPTNNLQQNLCSRHDEVMKMFCRTDQQCICYLCSVDLHKDHHTVTAAAERAEKQKELQAFRQNILHKLHHKQKYMDHLKHQVRTTNCAADAAVELCDKSHKELTALLVKRIRDVKQQIKAQQEADEHRVKELHDKMQQEITELKRTFTEMDKLSRTEDHIQFLNKFTSLSKVGETSVSVHNNQTPPPLQDMVTAAVSKLKEILQESVLTETPATLNDKVVLKTYDHSDVAAPAANHSPQHNAPSAALVTAQLQQSSEELPTLPQRNLKPKINVHSSPSPPPDKPGIKIPSQLAIVPHLKSTRELREYVKDLTLDPQSLNDKLFLCHENHCVENVLYSQEYSPNPARFTHFPQVVSKQVLTGRYSWMVDAGNSSVFIAVAYKSIRRDGPSDECCFGKNDNSWALEYNSYMCDFWHNGTKISIRTKPGKIVVFLDCSAGILSFFYRVDNKLNHIHTVRTTFTKPLVAGIGLKSGCAKLCGPEFY